MADIPTKPHKLPRLLFKLLLGAIVACALFLAGYGLGVKQPSSVSGGYDAGYSDGYDAAKQKLADSGLFPERSITTFMMGTVTEVGSEYVDFKTVQAAANPLEEPAPLDRRALIGPDTKIYRVDPAKGTRAEIVLGDVAVGDSISVLTSQDITYADSFTPIEISVTEVPKASE